MGRVRVFHCDDSEAYRVLVREVLADAPDIELVGAAGSAQATLDGVRAVRPDVVLLDLRGEDLGPATVGHVRAAVPEARIVVLSGWQGELDTGPIDALVSKDDALDELVPTIRRVAAR
jgi:DNA-binding NarL/FixJ family response regulator